MSSREELAEKLKDRPLPEKKDGSSILGVVEDEEIEQVKEKSQNTSSAVRGSWTQLDFSFC
jgi:hypothetical protein